MLQLRPRDSLSGGDFGWLKARHHFKVTPRGNPAHEPLCALVVWNDDEIAPGGGFDLHGHKNMEIISYVREGAVNPSGHAREPRTDGSRRRPGHERRDRHPPRRAQRRRSPAEAVPIWLLPRAGGGRPDWSTRKFPKADRAGSLAVLASGDPSDVDALPIRADARVLGATLMPGNAISYELAEGRYAYLAPARGVVTVNGQRLETGDGVAAISERRLDIRAEDEAEIVLVDTGPAPSGRD